jgi:hypothetical protein
MVQVVYVLTFAILMSFDTFTPFDTLAPLTSLACCRPWTDACHCGGPAPGRRRSWWSVLTFAQVSLVGAPADGCRPGEPVRAWRQHYTLFGLFLRRVLAN